MIAVIAAFAIWKMKHPSAEDIVLPNTIYALLIIPLTVALLFTLWITTTSHLASSGRANHEVDKSILFITLFGVLLLHTAILMASSHGDMDEFEFGLNICTIVAALLQVNHIYHNYRKQF